MEHSISEKVSWKPLIAAGIFALVLARIIDKEISLPTPLILSVGILGGLSLLLSSLFRPEVPFYVLVAYIPFTRILPGNFGGAVTAFNLMNLLCGVTLIGLLARSTKEGGFWQKSNMNVPILLFALIGAVSVLRGSWEYGTWYFWREVTPLKRWLTPMFFYFLALWIVRDRRTLKTVVLILLICVTVVGLMAIKDYIDVGPRSSLESERIGGIAEQPNMLAAFFSYYMFIFGAFFLCNSTRPRYWLLLIPFLICFRGIQVTFSRGGYLAFFTGAFALAFFKNKGLFVFSIVALIFAFMNPVLLPKGIAYRLLSTFQNVEPTEQGNLGVVAADIYKGEDVPLEGSAQGRIAVWKGAFRIIANFPLWGTGYGTFGAVVPFYAPELRGSRLDAHNSYLVIAAEMGLPALFIFLWVLFLVIWKTYRLYKTAKDPFIKATALGFLAGLFALLMANMFGSRLHHEEISGYFWVLTALMVRGLLLEQGPVPQRSRVGTKRVAAQTIPAPIAAKSRSLSATLRRLDRVKYGGKR